MKEEKQMNILYCCDTNYAIPMTVSITSIFENNKDSSVTVYVFYSSLSEDQKQKLSALSQQYNKTISLIFIEEHYFKTAPTLRWTKEAYYRLLVTELLPQNLDRILYLDCDTIINKSLSTLFDFDLKNKYIAALKTEMEYKNFGPRLNLLNPGDYYQSGVLLFDFQKVKQILNYKESIKVIHSLGENLKVVDQDVINVMFYNKIASLPTIYNNDEITNFYRNNKLRILNYIDKKFTQDTVVFHYAAGKPWNNLFPGSCENIWYKYLKKSPYVFLYEQKYNNLYFKISRLGLFKYIYYIYGILTPYINNFFNFILPNSIYVKIRNIYRKKIK